MNNNEARTVPSVSVTYARNGASTKANALGMRPMQERAYEKRGEQYLLIKSPPASGKSRALMFVALDKLQNQGLKQAIIVVPEKSIGASFNDEPLSKYGFWSDWKVEPKWNLCNAPGNDNGGKVKSLGAFLESDDKVLVCTHATFRFAVDAYGVEAFDDRLISIDEFHHVSANPDNKLGLHLGQFFVRGKTHIVAMTGSYFRGDAEAVLAPSDESKFDTVTYTYYEQLNGYEYLKQLDIGYFFYSGPYVDDILNVLDPAEKTIIHIPNVNSRESTKDKMREVEHIIEALGEWQGIDPATGFQLVKRPDGRGQHSFGGELEADDVESGTIYVLRSLSDHPYVARHREIFHKVGVTGGRVETRIANAEDDSTCLLAKVEVVATYKLAGVNRTRMENLFHRLFAPARLNITINDRFGHPVQPEEWFLVPLFVIDEAVARIKDGSVTGYIYDPAAAKLLKA